MKKIFFSLVAIAAFAISIRSAVAQVFRPELHLPISETIYKNIQAMNGDICTLTKKEGEQPCSDLAKKYNNKILFRAGHEGEMIRLRLSGDDPYEVLVTRFLPDGFYKSGSDYYFVADNKRVRLGAKNAYFRFMNRIQNDTKSYINVSTKDFSTYLSPCADAQKKYGGKKDILLYKLLLDTCGHPSTAGTWRKSGYDGKVLMHMGQSGKLYFVDADGPWPYVTALGKEVNGKSLFEFIKNNAISVAKKTILEVPSYE